MKSNHILLALKENYERQITKLYERIELMDSLRVKDSLKIKEQDKTIEEQQKMIIELEKQLI